MCDQVKLDQRGKCPACDVVTAAKENTSCVRCKKFFHSACPMLEDDNKPGTKSMIAAFNAPSTKTNFKFFCDICATGYEFDEACSEDKRLTTVEESVTSIKKELEEIKNLLKNQRVPKSVAASSSNNANIWFDKERLAATKVMPAKPLLVVSNVVEANSESIEKVIVEKGITVTKSYKNNTGDLVLECDTDDTREKLRTAVASTSDALQLKMLTGKKASVTIVGLNQPYSKDEILNQIVSQNQFVKYFSTVNDIREHIEIHDVKPTRAKPSVYQAFASVSEALRKGFANYKDKITIGIQTCKIYERFHVKRCNNCQGLGHYYKECQTPNEPCCAKCGGNHPTNTCESTEKKCTNCTKEGNEDTDHYTYDPKCPTMLKLVHKKKNSHLNSRRSTMAHL